MKGYGVRFFTGEPVDGVDAHKCSQVLAGLAALAGGGSPLPQWADGNTRYELRDFVPFNGNASFRGVLAVLRDDAPHIRRADGAEHPITLQENEHVIEKNHFLYFRARELLIWQVNGRASHVSRFEKYLSHCAGFNVVFADVLTASAIQRIDQGVVKSFEMRIARPRNAALIPSEDWERGAMELLNGAGGGSISISISTRSRTGGLAAPIKAAIHRLLDRGETRSLRVKLQGETEPIDLFAERLSERIEVEMHGLYPNTATIFEELAAAKERQDDALDEIFGTGDAVLD